MNKDYYIMGKNSLMEVLLHKPHILLKVFLIKSKDIKQENFLKLLNDKNIDFSFVDKNKLSKMVFSDSHQGIVATIKPRNFHSIEDFLNKDKCILLMLDNILDPQNVGSILRSAECFNIDGVIFSKNRGCEITPTVSKTSSGASELIKIIKVSNLHNTIIKLKKNDFEVFIADVNEKAKNLKDFDFPDKSVLIMGSEQKGVQPLLKKEATEFLKIPMHGKIDSLNVSQATAILLFKATSN